MSWSLFFIFIKSYSQNFQLHFYDIDSIGSNSQVFRQVVKPSEEIHQKGSNYESLKMQRRVLYRAATGQREARKTTTNNDESRLWQTERLGRCIGLILSGNRNGRKRNDLCQTMRPEDHVNWTGPARDGADKNRVQLGNDWNSWTCSVKRARARNGAARGGGGASAAENQNPRKG